MTSAATEARVEKVLEKAEIKKVLVEDLNIDHKYQRELNMRLVQRIAAGWNPAAGEPVLVSRRKSGKLFVVNGQHRVSAAKIIHKKDVLAVIVSGLDAAGEAELRLRTNVQVAEKPYERFKAQLAAGYEESLDIIKIVSECGTVLNVDAPNSQLGLNGISTVEMVYRVDDGSTLREVLQILNRNYRELNGGNAHVNALRALSWFVNIHDGYHPDWLDKALHEMSAAAWTSRSRQLTTDMGGTLWLNTYRALVEAYNDVAPSGGELNVRTRGARAAERDTGTE